MKTRSWLVACLLVVMGAGNAQEGGKTPREELEKRLASSQNIQALGDDLFGDAVALQNGALSFSATDVSIPGNSALPVAFARTYTAFNRWGYGDTGSRLGDWDIDLPNISGVFAPNWTISDPYLNSTSGARCSSGRLPTQPLDDYTVRDFWHGNTLHIPGGGGGEILSPNGGQMPTTVTTYKWVTADNFRLTCLATINNGTGEGFLALAPDGTKYWFNHMAQYKEPRLEMVGRQDSNGRPDAHPVQRRKNVLYATRVEDQFGNWVEYDFSNNSNEAAKLYAIRSSDNRRIDITYVSERVNTVATGTRSWSYHYGVTPSGRRTLTSVVLPDHTRWQLALGPLTDAHIKYPPGGISERDCVTNDTPENNAQQFAGRMVHPSGAIGDFRAGIRLHGRANVLMVCENVTGVPRQAAT